MAFRNGFRTSKLPEFGPGGERLNYNQLSETELAMLANYQPALIYGRSKPEPPDNFVPATVAYDKKVIVEIKQRHYSALNHAQNEFCLIHLFFKGSQILWLFQAKRLR